VSPFDPAWGEDAGPGGPEGALFCDAVMAAALLAVDPVGLGGVVVRSWADAKRDAFVAGVTALFPAGTLAKKMPLGIADDRLLGGLDIAATLQAGRPVMGTGLLAEIAGGVMVVAMAERLSAFTAGRVAAALDAGAGFAVVALDEGLDAAEAPPKTLLERLAFTVGETGLPGPEEDWPEQARLAAARTALSRVTVDDKLLEQICGLAAAFGIDSLRPALFAIRAAKASAALAGRSAVEAADIEIAARLVLIPRATKMPSAPDEDQDETPEEPPESEQTPEQSENEQKPLEDSVAEAEKAVLPPELLAALAGAMGPRRMARGAGQSGKTNSPKRGRPAGSRRGQLGRGKRLALLETLRAAAPWQRLRTPAFGQKIVVKKDDFRVKRFKEQARTVAIFSVDASGSSAINRLAEAKGAIQLLLADCYVRRDQVALLAFRNKAAELLLAPTHALARAKRSLAGLPGGGPTPLASGIDAARALAESERRAGKLPLLVVLTDGGANIGRTGAPGRAAAAADALAAAQACRAQNFSALVVDTAPRPQKFVQALAAEMGARYLALPYADAGRLSAAVQAQGGQHARNF
jgi:magnesium chelatase subunit D